MENNNISNVSLKNIQKTYLLGKQSVPALRGIDIEIQNGEFIGVTGPSGCGKTTLLNLIGAIDKATRGTIIVNDINLTTASDNTLADIRLSTILTLSSGACGALIGYILAYTFEFQSASFSESPIIFVVPWFLLTFLFVTSLIVGVLGAVIPERIVVSKSPVKILRRA